jgi:hypothetical protein
MTKHLEKQKVFDNIILLYLLSWTLGSRYPYFYQYFQCVVQLFVEQLHQIPTISKKKKNAKFPPNSLYDK